MSRLDGIVIRHPKDIRVTNLRDLSMDELFRMEVESQSVALTESLLELERSPQSGSHLESAMRAAHSLKGAARLVGREQAEKTAHAMEDVLVGAQRSELRLDSALVDTLLRGVDLLARASVSGDAEAELSLEADVAAYVSALGASRPAETDSVPTAPDSPATFEADPGADSSEDRRTSDNIRMVRVSAQHLNQMLALAGETLVSSRELAVMRANLLRVKKLTTELDRLLNSLHSTGANGEGMAKVTEARSKALQFRDEIEKHRLSLDGFDQRLSSVSHRLYDQVLASRMRPFSDGLQGIRRQGRDLARSLGKMLLLEVSGESTPVDRDVLQRLESPLTQILRNMIDHGLESPQERAATGKPPDGKIAITARHGGGRLGITMTDDGRGIDVDRVRSTAVRRGMTTADLAARMTTDEVLAFLFLPGFTLRETVTALSGRGVGLDIVQTAVKELGGSVAISSELGKGTSFRLDLPITRSVVRAIILNISGEAYAIPLTRIVRALRIEQSSVTSTEGRDHTTFGDTQLALVSAQEVIGVRASTAAQDDALSVVVLGDGGQNYGLVVDSFGGEQELVVRELDGRLGKIADVSAGAILSDGSPALVLDVDDLLRSIHVLATGGRLSHVGAEHSGSAESGSRTRRILVVDDSLTVRETERKLLENAGYVVDVAFDGMEGWNAVRTGAYDMVVTDVDMPRMDGIELVRLIRSDSRTSGLPVMIVSYKDREEDRRRGLEAGADFYLTKASFHDETLLQAVADLLGGAKG